MQKTTKKLAYCAAISVLGAVLSLLWQATGYAQVPLIASFLHWNGGATLTTQGGYLGWNRGGVGDSDFENVQGSGTGGYNWYNTSSHTFLMGLDYTGLLVATNGFSGNLTGNVTGNLAGNATGAVGTFGNLIAACNGCGGGPWNPGSYTSGLWFGNNNNGGSNGESDFINRYTAGSVGGFSWWSTTASSLSGQIMNLTPAGVLTLSSVHAALVGNVTGAVTGNASTATALASAPGACAAGLFPAGVNTGGNAVSCQSEVYAQKGTFFVGSQNFSSSAVTHFTLTFSLGSAAASNAIAKCSPQSDFGDEVQYTCWAQGSTLYLKLTHGTVNLPYSTNAVTLNYAIEQ